jgi:hypothetical protein
MKKATVRPEKWRATANEKIALAQHHWYELVQSERPEQNRYFDAPNYLAHLVGAARGVYQVTETLVGLNYKPWPWRDRSVKTRLTPTELALWRTMRDVRVAEEHGEGADLIQWQVPLPTGALSAAQISPNFAALRIPPSERGEGGSKLTARFGAYPDRPASEVAREYIELCNRFADDFEREHQRLFGAKTP